MKLLAKRMSKRVVPEKRYWAVSRLNRMLPRLKISDFSE